MFKKQSLYSLTRHYGSESYRVLVECIWCEKYAFGFITAVSAASIVYPPTRTPNGIVECINSTVYSGFGGLEGAYWPWVPKFTGSYPAEAVGFLGRKKILSTPFGGEIKPSAL
jgi:hypothetical protein